MESRAPLVSVVTPVYNGEAYLAECMESVLAQSYSNWEYVLCDNRSTDRTPEIAREIAGRDERIRIVRFDEFVGQIANWNRSLRAISPQASYVKVVHADDLLFPECLARMVDVAERHPSAGLVSSYALWADEVRGVLVPPPVELVAGREIARLTLLRRGEVFGSPTTTLVRADLIRGRPAFYDDSLIHADTDACFNIVRESDLAFVHQVLSFTRLHPKSITSASDRVGSWLPERIEMLLAYGPEVLDAEEYEQALRRALRQYAALLGKRAVRLRLLRDPRTRAYHAESLRRIAAGLRSAPPRSKVVAAAGPASGALARVLGRRRDGLRRPRTAAG